MTSDNSAPIYILTGRNDNLAQERLIKKFLDTNFLVKSFDKDSGIKSNEEMAIKQWYSVEGDHSTFLIGKEKYMMTIAYQTLEILSQLSGNDLKDYRTLPLLARTSKSEAGFESEYKSDLVTEYMTEVVGGVYKPQKIALDASEVQEALD